MTAPQARERTGPAAPGSLIEADRIAFFLGLGFFPSEDLFEPVSNGGLRTDASLRQVAVETLEARVSGRTIAILGAADAPQSDWLADVAQRAGARDILRIPTAADASDFTQHLEEASALAAAAGEPFADPWLPILLAAARRARERADLCLCATGSTNIVAGAERHRRFSDTWRNVASSDEVRFRRDRYMAEIAIFDDAHLLGLAGPGLAPAMVFRVADVFGAELEAAEAETGAALAARFDRALSPAAERGLSAVSTCAGLPVVSPFLMPSVRIWADVTAADAPDADDTSRAWPTREPGESIRQRLTLDPVIVAARLEGSRLSTKRRLIGKAALRRLLTALDAREPMAGMRVWTLCALEAWLEACEASVS